MVIHVSLVMKKKYVISKMLWKKEPDRTVTTSKYLE